MNMFMWLVRHGKIMCNEERKKRHLTVDENCHTCANEVEIVEHFVKRCPIAKSIWKSLLGTRGFQQTESLGFRELIDANLEGKFHANCDEGWPALFMLTTWWLWKWRNELIFKKEDHDHQHKMEWLMR